MDINQLITLGLGTGAGLPGSIEHLILGGLNDTQAQEQSGDTFLTEELIWIG